MGESISEMGGGVVGAAEVMKGLTIYCQPVMFVTGIRIQFANVYRYRL